MAANGLPSEQHLAYWGAKARGGIGLIITEADNVHPSSGTGPTMIQLWRDEIIEPFRRIANHIHEHGARIVAQLNHSGRNTYGMAPVEPMWSASPIKSTYEYQTETPYEPTVDDLQDVVQAYASAAGRIREAGLDGVEIHAAHDYFLEQFMSPKSNQRADEYGGSEDNRLRLIREVIDAVRAQVGSDFTVGLRVNGDEHAQGGLTLDDMERIVQKLTQSGKLDYVSVSGGGSGRYTIHPVNFIPPGRWVPLAARIKQVVDIPVICVGGITDPVMAEGILERHEADLVGMCRANIADPELPNKAREGRLDAINYCIRCMEGCQNSPIGMSCVVNPRARQGPETELVPAPVKKRVMVIGGGIAGIQAAWTAAMRGHQVVLYEREEQLGGQLQIAARAPDRAEMAEPVRYFTRQFELLEVPVRLGIEVDEELVRREDPDAVIFATGGAAQWPTTPIEGLIDGQAEGVNVFPARDVVAGKAAVGGDKVIVYCLDYGMEGLGTADYLSERGKQVEIFSPYPHIGNSVERITMKPMMLARLLDKGVKITVLTGVQAIRNGAIIARNFPPFGQREWPVEDVKDLVISAGSRANDALWRALRKEVKEMYVVGECWSPRLLFRSSLDGLKAGLKV
jgi:2,4-dienoyl-CoA reductase-like NADH-dependent reductase (Old Yellow Enzyme family)/thioredoxin reductase